MNARNFLYVNRFNKGYARIRADDKIATKKLFEREGIPTAAMLHVFYSRKSVATYDWSTLPQDGFAVKPSRGWGGEGILVFDRWDGTSGTTVNGKTYSLKQVKSHILDIFEGIYSLQTLPDIAYIEARVKPNPFLRKLSPIGLPDIRIIVFNKIPIMAMLRLPTKASGGKANLQQGAVGIGIEMRSGITNHAFSHGKVIKRMPETTIKIAGIRIPDWDNILLLAARTQAATGLGYAGIDIVIDRDQGPVVIEINARPGLKIQNVNQASLRFRLETVENLKVTTPARGVEIAKSIFADEFSDRVSTETKILSLIEPITITHAGFTRGYNAKIDTGALRTSLDESVVAEMGLPILKETFEIVATNGVQQRQGVKVNFILGGKKVTTVATVAKRSHMRYPIIIGSRDLKGFYVNPSMGATDEEDDIN